jgi:hypothetical protein
MAITGLQEFKQVLRNFRELSALAIKGSVAVPLLNLWLRFGPPPTAAMALLTSGMQFLAVMWVFHFWHDTTQKKLNRRMKFCAGFFCAGLLVSAVLLEHFTIRPNANRECVIEGYVVRNDVKPLLGPNYTPIDALREAEYDPSQVWTDKSITAVHTLLIVSWMMTFISVAMFISIFVILQGRRRSVAVGDVAPGNWTD